MFLFSFYPSLLSLYVQVTPDCVYLRGAGNKKKHNNYYKNTMGGGRKGEKFEPLFVERPTALPTGIVKKSCLYRLKKVLQGEKYFL